MRPLHSGALPAGRCPADGTTSQTDRPSAQAEHLPPRCARQHYVGDRGARKRWFPLSLVQTSPDRSLHGAVGSPVLPYGVAPSAKLGLT